jgi:hypothetical protein
VTGQKLEIEPKTLRATEQVSLKVPAQNGTWADSINQFSVEMLPLGGGKIKKREEQPLPRAL